MRILRPAVARICMHASAARLACQSRLSLAYTLRGHLAWRRLAMSVCECACKKKRGSDHVLSLASRARCFGFTPVCLSRTSESDSVCLFVCLLLLLLLRPSWLMSRHCFGQRPVAQSSHCAHWRALMANWRVAHSCDARDDARMSHASYR